MDVAAILLLIEKGVTVISALVSAGQSAAPAIAALLKLVQGAKTGTLTPEEMAATDALLDQQMADFNADLPPNAAAGQG